MNGNQGNEIFTYGFTDSGETHTLQSMFNKNERNIFGYGQKNAKSNSRSSGRILESSPKVEFERQKKVSYSSNNVNSADRNQGKLQKPMQESTSAQVHRSGRRSKAHSRHDHKCHKAKHKSMESLQGKGNRLGNENYLSRKNYSMSVDSGLPQKEMASSFDAHLGFAYQQLRNENAQLKYEIGKIMEENEDVKEKFYETQKENESLNTDITLMKNLVYKLNVELEKFQSGDRKFKEESTKTEKLPKSYEKNFLKPVLPLLKAYSEALGEKDDMIKDFESEYKKFSMAFNEMMQENEKLYIELEKKFMKTDGGVSNEVKVLRKDLEMARGENDLLLQQIKLEREKLVKVHSVFKVKVEEIMREKEEIVQQMEESKSELLVLRGKHAFVKQEFERLKIENDTRVPLPVYTASINECQKLFQDLKNEYENEKQRLLSKIKEQETTLNKQGKGEVEWVEEKCLLEKTNLNQLLEIQTLKKKVSELEENGEAFINKKEVYDLKKELRDANQKVEELSNKLSVSKKQLRKAMLFAEDIVRGQERLLLQLHAKQNENNYMNTQFGNLKSQIRNVEKDAQEGLNSIEEKIKSLEAENRALIVHNKKLEKLLEEKEEMIRELEPIKDS